MPTGLRIPVGVNKSGRAAIEKNESKNIEKILRLAFSEGGDANPFQKLGLDDRLIFMVKNSAFKGKALQAVTRIMAKYSELVRMDESTLEFDEKQEGEMVMSFKYIDLLTGETKEFVSNFKRKQ